jgi:hypothetical protein
LRVPSTTDIMCGNELLLELVALTKEKPVDLQKILSDLQAEKDRIVRAIEALVGMGSSSRGAAKAKATGRPKGSRRRGRITPEGRRRLSLAMKKRWRTQEEAGLTRRFCTSTSVLQLKVCDVRPHLM